MTNPDDNDHDGRTASAVTRRNVLATLIAAPLATCVSLGNQPPAPTCGRARSPDDCANFQKFRVERYNRSY